jgi:glycosyl transferase family 25
VIPVYVIALSDSSRVINLESDLRDQNMNFVRIDAVDGRRISSNELFQMCDLQATYARLGYRISDSLLGCALSHKKVYTKGWETSSDWILVLEEDVRLQDNFSKEISNLLNLLRRDEPIICQLFTRGERFVACKSLFKINSDTFLFRFKTPPGQTAAYLINRKALEVIHEFETIIGPPDWPNWSSRVSFYGTFPYLVEETGDGSVIGTPPLTRKKYWLRNLSKISGFHFCRYRNSYENISTYVKFEFLPMYLRYKWKFKGSPTFPSNEKRGLWLV